MTPVKQTSSIFDKGVCLVLGMTSMGNHKKVSTSQIEADADKSMLRVSKQLLDSEELQAISKLDGAANRYVRDASLPSLFKAGTYLIPNGRIDEVDEKLQEFERRREQLITEFIRAIPALVLDSKKRLKELFNVSDYPGVSLHGEEVEVNQNRIQRFFNFEWRYVSFTTPEALSSQLKKREQDKARRWMSDIQTEAMYALRSQAQGVVEHLMERLTGKGDNGKKKVFRNSLVENLKGFVDTFDEMNIADDKVLAKTVDEIRKLTSGIDPEILRSSSRMRTQVSTDFVKIKEQLDKMMVDSPDRAISFSE